MGFLSGAMAAGIGNAAGQVVSNSQAELDVQNQQQMAQYKSGLDTDRDAASMRLQHSLGEEKALSAAGGAVRDANIEGDNKAKAAAAAAFLDPKTGIRKAADATANLGNKPLAPGGMIFDQQDDGTYKQVAENKNMTGADARLQIGLERAANASSKPDHFDDKVWAEKGKELTANMTKTHTDPLDSKKVMPLLVNAAQDAFSAARKAGQGPDDAVAFGGAMAAQLKADGEELLRDPKNKLPKGDQNAAQAMALQQRKARAAADQQRPAQGQAAPPAAAAAPPPAAAPPINNINGAMNSGPTSAIAPDYTPPVSESRSLRATDRRSAVARPAAVPDAQRLADLQSKLATLSPTDAKAAYAIQADPAFDLLSPAQKQIVFKAVNGR